jgi:hypothetical protein
MSGGFIFPCIVRVRDYALLEGDSLIRYAMREGSLGIGMLCLSHMMWSIRPELEVHAALLYPRDWHIGAKQGKVLDI